MRHMTAGPNLALVTSRMTKGESFGHVLPTRHITEVICLSSKTSNNAFVFPLYLMAEDQIRVAEGGGTPGHDRGALHNLSPEFLGSLEARLCAGSTSGDPTTAGVSIDAEGVFHYIYAILEAPSYRTRFAPFLKIDFPRIPLTSDRELFRELCRLGSRLVM